MGYFTNAFQSLARNPGSFTQSPGYQARMDAIMQAATRANSGSIGSGNYGYALEDAAARGVNSAYGDEWDRLAKAAADEQGNELKGQEIGNAFTLGQGQNALGFYRAGNDFNIAGRNADEAATRDWYDYSLGRDRNNITAADAGNRFNVDAYNAVTNRGNAQSMDWLRGDQSALDWRKAYGPRRQIY